MAKKRENFLFPSSLLTKPTNPTVREARKAMLCLGLAKKAFFQKRLAKNAGEKRFTGKKKVFFSQGFSFAKEKASQGFLAEGFFLRSEKLSFPRLSFFRKKGLRKK